jgi:hypothetical protein
MKRFLKVVIVVLSFIGFGILAFNIWNVDMYKTKLFEDDFEYSIDSEVFETELDRPSSLYVFNNNGKYGYISAETVKVVVKPIYKRAWIDDMETGLAACVNEDNKLGFINAKTGETVIPFQFDFDEDYNTGYSVFDYVFCNGICIVPGEGGKLGMIDKTGKLLLQIEYLDIINWRDKNTPNIILKKYADSESDSKYIYGVCDRNFNMIVPFEYNEFKKNIDYDNIEYDDNYYQSLKSYIVQKDGKYGILDTLFNVVLPMQYSSITTTCRLYCYYIVELNSKYGLLDRNFKTVLPVEYDWIGDYLGNFVAKKDYVQKLYDERGKVINDFYIEDDGLIDEVLQPVFEPGQSKLTAYIQYYLDGHYGIIDINKNVVVPAKYSSIKYLGNGNFACKSDKYSFIINDKNYSSR